MLDDSPSKGQSVAASKTRLFLHIGRGKSGSSTIQSLAKNHRKFLAAAGVFCPLTTHGAVNHQKLAHALWKPHEDAESLRKFSKALKRRNGEKVFISSEFLQNVPVEGLRLLKRLTRQCELRILFYIRDYPSWLPSCYAQRIKRCKHADDFDSYFDRVSPSVSVLPSLETWAGVFGWDAMLVRPFDASSRSGQFLIADVLRALEIDAAPPAVASLNVAPHWMALEFQRALTAEALAASAEIGMRFAKVALALTYRCTADIAPRRIQYLTRKQWHALAQSYRNDVAVLAARTGATFPDTLIEPGERPFLPSFDRVPQSVRERVRAEMRTERFRSKLEPHQLSLLERAWA